MLRLTIEQSEREATAEAAAKAKAARLAKQQDRVIRRMTGQISSDDDSDLTGGSSSNDDEDTPPAVDAYREGYSRTGDRKGKGPARKW